MDIQQYKVIYKDEVYNNCLEARSTISGYVEDNTSQIKSIEIIYIDSDNNMSIMVDDVKEFKFIKK